ncbi:MAG: outer membrane beta-barrel protein [Rikenellaceae bacterium]
MKIKKIIFTATALIASICATNSASAQVNLDGWDFGAKVNFYTDWDITGVGVYGRHELGGGFRIEPSFSFLFRRGASIDITADVHYPFDLGSNFEVYPLAGLSLNDPSTFGLGINVGGGAGYKISDRVDANLGLKWAVQTQTSNPFIVSFGAGYKF